MYFKALLAAILFLLTFSSTFSKDPVRSKNGMVASACGIATQVGVDILKNGGNAVDAAVATGFALAVTFPQAGNIGGGGFMVIHLKDGRNLTIDYREKAPLNAFEDMYLDEKGEFDINLSTRGWTASGVPGSVAGLIYALDNYGTMNLAEVIQPAIDLAGQGFRLDYKMAENLNDLYDVFKKYESTAKIFTKKDGEYQEGDLLKQTDLANTLSLIKNNGRDGFYKGSVADLIVEQSRQNGGYFTLEDLESYEAKEREPIIGWYRDHKIISMGPPSSGGVALVQALNIIENFNFDNSEWHSSRHVHLLSEALKQVYADRAEHLGDEDFYPVPKRWLTSKDYAESIAEGISDFAVPSDSIYAGKPPANESEETTHYSVVDSYGNAVSTTTTINSYFGNKIVVDGAGFFLNNEMDDFSGQPGVPNQFGLLGGEANSIQPGKRMLSAMTPTIVVKDDRPFFVVGSPGGSTIITTVFQIVFNIIDYDMNIRDAIEAPRFHHQWKPEQIYYEEFCLSTDVKNNLEARGQVIGNVRGLGRAQGIMIDDEGIIWGASDPRGNGKAIGY
jgi:gamma-glutamyltranspeptidase/glutathione hydrolase